MTGLVEPIAQKPGLEDVVFDSQRVFRAVLQAMSFPGRVNLLAVSIEPPAPLDLATAAVCLTLVDLETPVWLDAAAGTDEARGYLRFHCGCSIVDDPAKASFAIIADPTDKRSLSDFNQGDDRYPDRSATLIIQVPSFAEGADRALAGPGIVGSVKTNIDGLAPSFWLDWSGNGAAYPAGVDVLFTCGPSILGLPRTTWIED